MPWHARQVNNTCCLINKPWFLRQPGDLFRDIQSCWRVVTICDRAVSCFGELTESRGRNEGRR
jgi:hypothetical protein